MKTYNTTEMKFIKSKGHTVTLRTACGVTIKLKNQHRKAGEIVDGEIEDDGNVTAPGVKRIDRAIKAAAKRKATREAAPKIDETPFTLNIVRETEKAAFVKADLLGIDGELAGAVEFWVPKSMASKNWFVTKKAEEAVAHIDATRRPWVMDAAQKRIA